MCGIAGIAGPAASQAELEIQLLVDALEHRGPDDSGVISREGVRMGMRRLSIVDVAHGKQPVVNEDGSIFGVFNGEIYNYREIQAWLRSRGHTLNSDSDSECLVHLYEELGQSMVHRLRGMFALAIWDARRNELFIARDRVGKKPLYYREDHGTIRFASELKSLLKIKELPVTIDPLAIDEYLTFQYVPHPRTIYKEIKKLPPAHTLTWERGNLCLDRYWKAESKPARSMQPVDEQEIAQELRDRLEEATRIRLIGDRPIGAFLSGGVDSSAVVAAMSRAMAQPVKTFSIGFENENFNELRFARQVAELYETDHTELVVRPQIEDLLPEIASGFDEPFADSSAVPTFLVSKLARTSLTVALNGDGGDEAFAGYRRYRVFSSRAPVGSRAFMRIAARACSTAGAKFHLDTFRRAAPILDSWGSNQGVLQYARFVSYFDDAERTRIYTPEFVESLIGFNSYARFVEIWNKSASKSRLGKIQEIDYETYLPGDLLPKVDISTMMVSLEARSPFLDHELVEWALTIPEKLRIRHGTEKYILKKAMEDWLPREVIYRRKMGFGIPRDEWLAGELNSYARGLLLSSGAFVHSYVDRGSISNLFEEHALFHNRGAQIWALMMLEIWFHQVHARR